MNAPAIRGGEPVRTKDNFLVFGAPAIGEPEIEEVVDSLRTGWLGTGPKVARFEEAFARYLGEGCAVAVSSCTAALHLALLGIGIGPGDEVITTPLTFVATINSIIHAGATPVLADVDPRTMNIDPGQVEKKLTSRTRAILPVHFAGRPCDMKALTAIADRNGLRIVEDCAHAIETRIGERPVGLFGDFGCFSFYATKNVVTGEGGMVITRSEEAAARIKRQALHGLSKDAWRRYSDDGYKHYYAVEVGFKYNMMDLQAAIGLHQLERVSDNWRRREAIWQRYQSAFAHTPLVLPSDPGPDTRHAFHLYTVLVDGEKTGIARDDFLTAMAAENIGVGVHYVCAAEHPCYHERFAWKASDFPHATKIGLQTVSLPLSPKLSDQDVADVIAAVTRILDAYAPRASS